MGDKKSKLSRTVERNCIEVEKAADWNKRQFAHPIVHVQPFIPEHAFHEDDLYLKLSANLTAREIEWCKARIMGFSSYNALEQIQPTLSAGGRSNAAASLESRDDLFDLIKHFKNLWEKYHNPFSFDPSELLGALISEWRNEKTNKKFDMGLKLAELLGMEEPLREIAKKRLKFSLEPETPEESIDELIARLRTDGTVSRNGHVVKRPDIALRHQPPPEDSDDGA